MGVEVDPKGGPRIQEAAMRLYREKSDFEKIHLLQALQAVEAALKKFFYAYKQVLVALMGSLEAKGNAARAAVVVASSESCDSLTRLFLEPTYFPSLDAAKTHFGGGGDRLTGEWKQQRRQGRAATAVVLGKEGGGRCRGGR
ncbi:unnamed protein product [Linum tenue]|uniref:Hs1pro-1 C-terminal domain-containing protein n=1 Tax=Linum tenue TaxID=586396 RepID=A0AAV0Q1H6_9ROSI|nr:unnamed protein product [Linum tenue]